jgi:type II secretory pathway pseudopilin PulG
MQRSFFHGPRRILHSRGPLGRGVWVSKRRGDLNGPRPEGPRLIKNNGYTLVELFLTLAVLMIVLGLMINLSNRVRRESADKVTRQVLARLTVLMAEYQKQNDDQLPPTTPLIDLSHVTNESTLQISARENSADFVRYLKLKSIASNKSSGDDMLVTSLNDSVLEDPWGSPIVFMPGQNPAIGMAPSDAFFFFSAGPDRQFLTREDNVYSYEQSGEIH